MFEDLYANFMKIYGNILKSSWRIKVTRKGQHVLEDSGHACVLDVPPLVGKA